MFRLLFIASMLCWVCITPRLPLSAQETKAQNRLGVGIQAGSPNGITLKYYIRKNVGVVALGSWDLERTLLFSSHIVYESPLPDSPLRFFGGPGAFIKRDDSNNKKNLQGGLGLIAGLNFFVEKFEVFLQANSDLRILPNYKLQIGGAVGLRYFF